MPVLARFLGITIKMYFMQAEHNPPHVHVEYGDYACAMSIEYGAVLDGAVPFRQERIVRRWISAHQDEIYEMWSTQAFHRID